MGAENDQRSGPSATDPRLLAFDYPLPNAQIARHPPTERDGGRLMDLRGPAAVDSQILALPGMLEPGDLLVVNDTRVLMARVFARRETGARVEALLLGHEGEEVEALVRPARRIGRGERLVVLEGPGGADLAGFELHAEAHLPSGHMRLRACPSVEAVIQAAGQVPLPPYLGRPAQPEDRVRYQTIFAARPGAVAAPTAGLHLSPLLLQQLEAREISLATVTLHVGAGTFRNLRTEDLDRGTLHAERYHLPVATVDAIAHAKARGGRVVAVGTTTVRVLESVARGPGGLRAGEGETRLFLQPGDSFGVVDLLLTNFHLPKSSLLMLACAFGGTARVLAAYGHAVEAGYRFFSYGDAMLLGPHKEARP